MHKKNAYLLIAVLFSVFITVISLKESEGLSNILIPFSDKVLHLSAYIVLTVLWSKYLTVLNPKTKTSKVLIIVLLFLTVYGIIIEVLQSQLTVTRMSEFNDIVANFSGIVIGILIFKYFNMHKLKTNKGLFF